MSAKSIIRVAGRRARRDAHAFSSVECEFLRQLSEHVALAAQQAQLYESLQQAYDDLRKTQVAAMQEERLRALGQMASGIAHDINNALSPVSLYTEMLLETEKEPLAPAVLDVLGLRHARLTVTEGRYHQVRRMFAAAGNHVETLRRISVGGLTLGELPLGEWRAIGADEVALIFQDG